MLHLRTPLITLCTGCATSTATAKKPVPLAELQPPLSSGCSYIGVVDAQFVPSADAGACKICCLPVRAHQLASQLGTQEWLNLLRTVHTAPAVDVSSTEKTFVRTTPSSVPGCPSATLASCKASTASRALEGKALNCSRTLSRQPSAGTTSTGSSAATSSPIWSSRVATAPRPRPSKGTMRKHGACSADAEAAVDSVGPAATRVRSQFRLREELRQRGVDDTLRQRGVKDANEAAAATAALAPPNPAKGSAK
eukprot:CAMPEP_0171127250 /NCGR_PEP_ID=MMETSP0766_2-20121228/114917_1 /TAXON_ID=439317 /ORGANISM="Gambierdiscus australes, Strain CAWD 149" /LENGTH=251 /DNA_ID=CAMNT_0011590341 /DNA_START=391 /DNA_END=1147 /DNA_ORIENTATION=-